MTDIRRYICERYNSQSLILHLGYRVSPLFPVVTRKDVLERSAKCKAAVKEFNKS